jgi:uncharacterized repeat protein (TIGR04042 family)
MPEVSFVVEWPDGTREACYSPSTVVLEFFAPNDAYPLPDFIARCREALNRASDRVAAKYGYTCSAAHDQLARLEEAAARFGPSESRPVKVIALSVGPPVS